MGHVFISYSRTDIGFVRVLHEALAARGHEAWVDWEGIEPSAEWMARIESAIDAADSVVFVISPDSCASQVCGQELDHAIRRNKRLIPVLHRPPEPDQQIRDEIAKINWIFARETDSLEEAVTQLVEAIETDLQWVTDHTRLLVRAVEWDRQGRDVSFTLRGTDLTAFENWLAKAPEREPKPTALQSEYLLTSRRAVTRRQRIVWASLAAGLAIAVGLGTVAWFQAQERDRQAEIAEARRLLSQAEALRDGPDDADDMHTQRRRGLQAAVSALATLDRLGQSTADADRSVRQSLAALPKWQEFDLPPGRRTDAAGFDREGRQLAFHTGFGALQLWSTKTAKATATCPVELTAAQSVRALAVAANGQVIAHIHDASRAAPGHRLVLWSMPECEIRGQIDVDQEQGGGMRDLTLTDDGRALVRTGNDLQAWDRFEDGLKRLAPETKTLDFVVGPAQKRLAAYERQRGTRESWLRIRDVTTGRVRAETRMPNRFRLIAWTDKGLIIRMNRKHHLYSESAEEIDSVDYEATPDFLSLDGERFAKIGRDGVVSVFDAVTGRLIARDRRRAEFQAAAFRPDGRSLFVAGKSGVLLGIWHFAENGTYAELETNGLPDWIGYSADGQRLIVRDPSGQAEWRLPAPGQFHRPEPGPSTLEPDRRRMQPDVSPSTQPDDPNQPFVLAETALPGGPRVALWATRITRGGYARKLESRQGSRTLAEREIGSVLDGDRERLLILSQNGRFVFAGSSAGVEMFGTSDLDPITEIFHAGVQHAGASFDGRTAVTVDQRLQARIWDIESGTERARFTLPNAPFALEPSTDGRWLAVLRRDGGIDLMATAPADLAAQACRWLPAPCPDPSP